MVDRMRVFKENGGLKFHKAYDSSRLGLVKKSIMNSKLEHIESLEHSYFEITNDSILDNNRKPEYLMGYSDALDVVQYLLNIIGSSTGVSDGFVKEMHFRAYRDLGRTRNQVEHWINIMEKEERDKSNG